MIERRDRRYTIGAEAEATLVWDMFIAVESNPCVHGVARDFGIVAATLGACRSAGKLGK